MLYSDELKIEKIKFSIMPKLEKGSNSAKKSLTEKWKKNLNPLVFHADAI